jgi:hypothetical protein
MTRSSHHGLHSIVLETSVRDPVEDYGPGVRSRDCSARQNASNGESINLVRISHRSLQHYRMKPVPMWFVAKSFTQRSEKK